MGFTSGDGPESGPTTLAEINVTPLVDVMLVLLTIFMIASSVETIQVKQEKQALLKEQTEDVDLQRELERLRRLEARMKDQDLTIRRERRMLNTLQWKEEKLKKLEEELEDKSQNVPIELPKVTSEPVNLAEQRKIVVLATARREIYIGDTRIADCGKDVTDDKGKKLTGEDAYRFCLGTLKEKLIANKKLQDEGECYLKADRSLPYGQVLALMATIRNAGVTRFGLVSEEDDLPKDSPAAAKKD